MAVGDGAVGVGDVGDALAVEDSHAQLRFERAGQLQIGRGRHGHGRHGARQAPGIEHAAADHVEEIDHAAPMQKLGHLQAVAVAHARFQELVARHADADDEVRAHLLARLLQHFEREARAVLEAAAVFVRALVGDRAPETVEQILKGALELEPVEPAFLGAARGLAISLHHAADVPILHGLGVGAVERLAHAAGGDRRQPRLQIPARLAADMAQLHGQLGAMAMDAVGHLLEIGNDRIVGRRDLVVLEGRRIDGHRGDAAEHGEAEPALGLLRVIELIALLRLALLGIAGRVARAHDPVAEGHALKRERLQERVVLPGHPRPPSCARHRQRGPFSARPPSATSGRCRACP